MEIQLRANKLFELSLDNENIRTVYKGKKYEDKIFIKSNTDRSINIKLYIDNDKDFVSFSKDKVTKTLDVSLLGNEEKGISLYFTPNNNIITEKSLSIKIKGTSDYSLNDEKIICVKFRDLINPIPELRFTYTNNQNNQVNNVNYYKGNGKCLIGQLAVTARPREGETENCTYTPLDLSTIRQNLLINNFSEDCLIIDKSGKPSQLLLNKQTTYDVYFNFDGDYSGDVMFNFKLSEQTSNRCRITIKNMIDPEVKMIFTFVDNRREFVYYKGEGNNKIGQLNIRATGTPPFDRYKPLDLSGLLVEDDRNINCLTILDKDNGNKLFVDHDISYDIYCNYDGIERGEIRFEFRLGAIESGEYRIRINKQTSPVGSRFEPVGELDFLELKDTGIVGHLISNYTSNKDDKRYYTIENGVYKITDENYSFDKEGKVKEQFLEVGDKKYPIYINFNKVFGDKLNIDQDASLNIQELQYTDSRDTDVIDALLTLKHTPAKPEPYVYLTTNYSDENKELVQGNLEFEQWRYDSNLNLHMSAYEIANLNFSNNQILPCGDNRIKWDNIKIKGNCIIPIDGIDDIEINNGGEKKSIPIIADLARITDETNEITIAIEYQCTVNDLDAVAPPELEQFSCTINIPILEEVVDDWYSIDLGTTGIVVAKWNQGNGISAVHLDRRIDANHAPIETSDNIISSTTVLMEANTSDDSKKCKVVVAPSSQDLKQKAKYMLVPTKFMVGQDVLPFINEYKKRFPDGILLDNEDYSWDTIRPEDILKYTYRDIFSRVSPDECEKVRKLIVTYPNTYSPNSLDWLKQLIIGEQNEDKIFKNLSERNLHFIPESDSVVAYYISKLMDREDEQGEREHVVIYDMGAGTLDLSYVTIEIQDGEDGQEVKSTIEKRIGIPIAGEYFSYLIYECYKDDFQESNKKTIKTWIDKFKAGYNPSRKLRDVDSDSVLKQEMLDQEQGISETVEEWVEICTEKVLKQLLGNEWKKMIDRIVFSGRGSQFKPIRDKMREICEDIILDDKTISNEELKQCVANGAILYQQIFENPNMPFSIEHKNTYEHIGMCYQKLDGFRKKWEYKELMNEDDLIWDENVKDGAYFAHVEGNTINKLDLRYDGDIIFYLTSLDENAMSEIVRNSGSSKDEVFVKELFIFPSSILTGNRKNSTLRLNIDLDNNLSVSINGMNLLPHTTLPNVEKDKYYVKCNWYFDNEKINN